MCGNVWQIHPVHSLLSVTENDLSWLKYYLYWWQGFNTIVCRLMITTNNRCVQSLNISVDVAKCVENYHKFTQYTPFLSVTKMTCLDWTIYSWQGFNSLVCPIMPRTNYRCAQSLMISVNVAKIVENFHKFTQYSHFCLSHKMTCLDWNIICSPQGLNTLVNVLLWLQQTTDVFSHSTSV